MNSVSCRAFQRVSQPSLAINSPSSIILLWVHEAFPLRIRPLDVPLHRSWRNHNQRASSIISNFAFVWSKTLFKSVCLSVCLGGVHFFHRIWSCGISNEKAWLVLFETDVISDIGWNIGEGGLKIWVPKGKKVSFSESTQLKNLKKISQRCNYMKFRPQNAYHSNICTNKVNNCVLLCFRNLLENPLLNSSQKYKKSRHYHWW